MSSKSENLGDRESLSAEKTSSLADISDQESSKSKEDSMGSKVVSSTHESLSPKHEDGENEVESDQEKELQIPTKRSKKTKSSQFLLGFCVDLAWCKKSKWTELLNILKFQKWLKLVSLDEGLFEKEMRDFCSSFNITEGVCVSVVNGSVVTLTDKKLSDWFQVPSEGYKEYIKGRAKLNVNGVSNKKILTFFNGNPIALSLDQKDLSPFHKLLFQFVWHFVLPRSSKRTQANLMDLSIMYCLAKNIKINFPSLMISHLSYCISHNTKIGYGNLITTIFKQSKVKLSASPSFNLEPENYLTKETMSRLSLRVLNGKLDFEREETTVKVETGSKRKLFKEGGTAGSVRKSQRLAGSKSLKEQNQGDAVLIHLDADLVPSTVVDFPLLSTTGLHGILRGIQESLTLLHSRISTIEAIVSNLDSQQQQSLAVIKQAETGIRNKVDGGLQD